MTKSNNLPAWDLSDLYKGLDDPQIEKDLSRYKKNALALQKKYKGKLEKLSAEEFLSALKLLEKNSVLGGRLGGFAYLNMSTQMKNPEAMIFYQRKIDRLCQAHRFLFVRAQQIASSKNKRVVQK